LPAKVAASPKGFNACPSPPNTLPRTPDVAEAKPPLLAISFNSSGLTNPCAAAPAVAFVKFTPVPASAPSPAPTTAPGTPKAEAPLP
jgi:hypothetical protein